MNGSMKELYATYKESTHTPLSYATFCLLKPFYVVHPEFSSRDTCLCKTCENARLLVRSLYNAKALEVSTVDARTLTLCCPVKTEDCLQRSCLKCSENLIPFLECDEKKKKLKLKNGKPSKRTGLILRVK